MDSWRWTEAQGGYCDVHGEHCPKNSLQTRSCIWRGRVLEGLVPVCNLINPRDPQSCFLVQNRRRMLAGNELHEWNLEATEEMEWSFPGFALLMKRTHGSLKLSIAGSGFVHVSLYHSTKSSWAHKPETCTGSAPSRPRSKWYGAWQTVGGRLRSSEIEACHSRKHCSTAMHQYSDEKHWPPVTVQLKCSSLNFWSFSQAVAGRVEPKAPAQQLHRGWPCAEEGDLDCKPELCKQWPFHELRISIWQFQHVSTSFSTVSAFLFWIVYRTICPSPLKLSRVNLFILTKSFASFWYILVPVFLIFPSLMRFASFPVSHLLTRGDRLCRGGELSRTVMQVWWGMPQLWAGFLNWFPTSHLGGFWKFPNFQIKHRTANPISRFLLLGPSADSAGRGDDRLWLLGSGANLANTFAYHVIMLQKSSDGGNAKKSLHQNWLSIH